MDFERKFLKEREILVVCRNVYCVDERTYHNAWQIGSVSRLWSTSR